MNRKGFTLIELLIVVVIIGILAAIAIPKFANTKEKAYIASMKSDLRNLVTAEEAYFADSVKYTAAYGAGGINFVQSTGNTTPAVTTTADGWTANITNVNTTKTCSIYIGSTALLPANKQGGTKVQETARLAPLDSNKRGKPPPPSFPVPGARLPAGASLVPYLSRTE